MKPIHTIENLEAELSRPAPGVLATLRALDGYVLVLGAGGKMGPTLARMVGRGFDQIGRPDRRVIAVSRFSSAIAERRLQQHCVQTITGEERETAWLWDATHSYELFGPPTVSLEEMIDATAEWQRRGGAMLGKPTHFEVRDGRF